MTQIPAQLDVFLDRLDLGVFRADLDGRLTGASPALRRLLRARSEHDLLGLDLLDLCTDRAERAALRSQLAAHGRIRTHEIELRHRDGTTGWFSVSMALAATPDGERWIDGLVEDIAARKRTEAALVASEERLRHLVETTRVIPWEIEPATWRFTYVGAQCEQILGFPPERCTEAGFWEACIHPEDRGAAMAAWRDGSRLEEEYEFSFRAIAADGGTRWLHNFVSVAFVDDEPRVVHGFLIDDTTRMAAEMSLREVERRYREMLENVDLTAVALDVSGRIVLANDFLLALTGYARHEVTDGDWFELFVPADQRDWVRSVFTSNTARGFIAPHLENEILTRDGRRRLVRWSNTILRDPDGRVVGTASIGEDVTDRRPVPAPPAADRTPGARTPG